MTIREIPITAPVGLLMPDHGIQSTYLVEFVDGAKQHSPMMRKLMLTPGIRLVDFTQADAYSRLFPYLNKLNIPMGSRRCFSFIVSQAEPGERQELLDRLDDIEAGANKMKTPLAYTNQFYVLRGHIRFVRERLWANAGEN